VGKSVGDVFPMNLVGLNKDVENRLDNPASLPPYANLVVHQPGCSPTLVELSLVFNL
jgi:hypothetical protein